MVSLANSTGIDGHTEPIARLASDAMFFHFTEL